MMEGDQIKECVPNFHFFKHSDCIKSAKEVTLFNPIDQCFEEYFLAPLVASF